MRCHVSKYDDIAMYLRRERRLQFHPHDTYGRRFQRFGNWTKPAWRRSRFISWVSSDLLRRPASDQCLLAAPAPAISSPHPPSPYHLPPFHLAWPRAGIRQLKLGRPRAQEGYSGNEEKPTSGNTRSATRRYRRARFSCSASKRTVTYVLVCQLCDNK